MSTDSAVATATKPRSIPRKDAKAARSEITEWKSFAGVAIFRL